MSDEPHARSRTPRGGFGELVLYKPAIIHAPPVAPVAKKPLVPIDEEYMPILIVVLIALLAVVMCHTSGTVAIQAAGMALMLICFERGIIGQTPAHAAFPAVFLVAVITVYIPHDLNFLKNLDVQKKADAVCAARQILVERCKSALGAEQTKKSFLDLVGFDYNPRNASHIALVLGK
jgi:hypothetical protein